MKKIFTLIVTLFIVNICFLSEADASTLTFEKFTPVRGVAVTVPYQAKTGTSWDPDTVTLAVDLSAPALQFQLTAVGSGFGGTRCELEWDDDGIGVPFGEKRVQLTNGGFNDPQIFNISASRLNLTAGGTRNVLYELEADASGGDRERHLRVTFIASGPSIPTNPIENAVPKLAFDNFTSFGGVTVIDPYKANTGTRQDPDVMTLRVDDLTAPTLQFQLRAVGSGFTSGSRCELDWDGAGAPRERAVQLSGGGFNVVQNFTVNTSRLGLTAGGKRTVLYELDVDEEPDSPWDIERHLEITFVTPTSDPLVPNDPVSGNDVPTLTFEDFTPLSGVTERIPYQANTGTMQDPDTVTLVVDEFTTSTLRFQLRAVGSRFTSGNQCQLDWDSEGTGAPSEQRVQLSNHGFDVVQNFSVRASRLNLTDGGTRNVLYELDVDEEPYDDSRWYGERYLRIAFVTSSTNPVNPNDPLNPPNDSPIGGADGNSGGGCDVTGVGLLAVLGSLVFLRRR